VTKDGVAVDLQMNAALLVDLQHVMETGAASIGLFRTEIQFMVVTKFPRMREQEAFYKSAFAEAGDKPITFRTLDIGSDKVLPYMTQVEEENPALGWRAIRIGLDRPALLRMQVRALLHAAGGRELRIMFPMIATVDEFDQAKALVDRELDHLRRHDYPPPSDLKLGVMVEVPALLWQLDELCPRVDFLSVGTNDLVQYLFAADRENNRVASRYDCLSVPILRALRLVVEKARAHATPLSLCGEMGGHPVEALALLAVGFRRLSMSPACIGPVKAMILATDIAAAEAFLDQLLAEANDIPSLRTHLRKFAEAHQIPV
jgi:phosphotransferase system, enzyme I, PtsP